MYKKILAYAVAIALAVTGITFVPSAKKAQAAADPTDGKWQLQWSDEFDGNSLNTNTWTYEIGTGQDGWGNWEVQYYTNRTQNVFVQDGLLNIRAQRENYNGSQFTSGRIITKNKKTFKYGKMEARIKVDGGNQDGVWPAFWMMGNDIDRVSWPACGELDIMEHANNNAFIGGTLHFGPNYQQHGMWGSGDTGQNKYFSDNINNGINGWHTYGVTWDENLIKWYMDNEVYFQADISEGTPAGGYFTKDAFFLLNLALGGTGTGYTGYKTPNANFQSATMQVDYVRAYQYNSSAPTQAPTQAPTTKAPDVTPTEVVSTNEPVTKKTPTTTKKPSAKVYVGKAKVKKAKKKSAKKIKVKLKKVKGATGYQVKAYKSKKKVKKNKKAIAKKVVTKLKFTFKSKKFRNKKKIYLRARAFVHKGQTKVYGAWSKPKKVKIKK